MEGMTCNARINTEVECWYEKLKHLSELGDAITLEQNFNKAITEIDQLQEASNNPLFLEICLNFADLKRKSNDIDMAGAIYQKAKRHFKTSASLFILWADMFEKCENKPSSKEVLLDGKKYNAVPRESLVKACSNFCNNIPICNGIDLPIMWSNKAIEIKTTVGIDKENTPLVHGVKFETNKGSNKKGFSSKKSQQSLSTSELLLPRRSIKKQMKKGNTISFDQSSTRQQHPQRYLFGSNDDKRLNLSLKKQPQSDKTLSCSRSTSHSERKRQGQNNNDPLVLKGNVLLDNSLFAKPDSHSADIFPLPDTFSISTRQSSMSSSSSSSSDGTGSKLDSTNNTPTNNTLPGSNNSDRRVPARQSLFKTRSQNVVSCKEDRLATLVKQNSETLELKINQKIATPIIQPNKSEVIYVNGKSYLKVKLIGKGGSAKVYKILDEEGKVLAMKFVCLEGIDDLLLKSYIKEIEILKELRNCQYVIDLYDWEIRDEKLFMVMEKGDQDLDKFLKSNKDISVNKIKSIWKMILKAVQSIHDVGIIHSDIKPANFMYVGSQLKLIDFGIARLLQANMTSITLAANAGTMNYMAPETLAGVNTDKNIKATRVNRALDVWSLACVLYYMVYKCLPYQHIMNLGLKVDAICNGRKINYPPFEDESLVNVMKGCLKIKPDERLTIDELLKHSSLRNTDIQVLECTPQMKKVTHSHDDIKSSINNIVSQITASPLTADRIMALAR